MRNPGRPLLLGFALAALALLPGAPATGQDAGDGDLPGGIEQGPPPKPLTPEEEKAAKALFQAARALQESRTYGAARLRFREFLKKYPGADPALIDEAEDRSGENCLVDIEEIVTGGPPERRIDFELMGDGYTIDKMANFRKDAENQLVEFWREPLYDEYESYFNVWRFDLISKEEGVDELSPEERMGAPPPPPVAKRSTSRKKRGPKKYSTALNCQAAGPQNQVWADPEMVMQWRKYFPHSDALSICFAKKGALGMGGMGIATTGKRVAVVHEVGHAFIGLLDEYAVNPNPPPPGWRVFAPNAISGKGPRTEPDPAEVPWKHWLEAKKKHRGPTNVELLLGGATYQLGVYRPAASCAMNSGGGSPYCWVCREAGVLKIYDYLSPLDESGPAEETVTLHRGDPREYRTEFWVQPMAPKTHRLTAEWFVEAERAVSGDSGGAEDPTPPPDGPWPMAPEDMGGPGSRGGGENSPHRASERRRSPLADGKPGNPVKAAEKAIPGAKGKAYRSAVTLPDLPPGRWKLTVVVKDDAKPAGAEFPWVLKDTERLLEERRTWTVIVTDAPLTPPATAPAPAGGGKPPGPADPGKSPPR